MCTLSLCNFVVHRLVCLKASVCFLIAVKIATAAAQLMQAIRSCCSASGRTFATIASISRMPTSHHNISLRGAACTAFDIRFQVVQNLLPSLILGDLNTGDPRARPVASKHSASGGCQCLATGKRAPDRYKQTDQSQFSSALNLLN